MHNTIGYAECLHICILKSHEQDNLAENFFCHFSDGLSSPASLGVRSKVSFNFRSGHFSFRSWRVQLSTGRSTYLSSQTEKIVKWVVHYLKKLGTVWGTEGKYGMAKIDASMQHDTQIFDGQSCMIKLILLDFLC